MSPALSFCFAGGAHTIGEMEHSSCGAGYRYRRYRRPAGRRVKKYIVVAAALAALVGLFFWLQRSVTDLLFSLSEATVRALALTALNEAVAETLQWNGIEYDSLVTVARDGEGEIVREVDLKKEMNKPATALDVGIWTVGNSYFEQYMVALPDDAADYDFIYGDFSGSTPASLFKMDLVTKSYNYENGKVTEHNFDAVVDDVEYSSYSDDGVFLSVRTISDKQPSASATLQYYGEDGNISVDLQDLLPGADEVKVTDEYVILKSPATISVYNTDGELLGSADARAVTFEDGYFVRSGSTTIVYNLEGEQVFSGKETAGHGGAYGEKVYQGIANGLIYYTIETKDAATSESTTTVYTYSEADGDKTLGEGEIVGMSSPLLQDIVYIYNSSSEDYTAYIKGYADPVATGLDSAIALDGEGASKLDDVTYALYSYTETVTSGSGETQTTESVKKYVFVTIA